MAMKNYERVHVTTI